MTIILANTTSLNFNPQGRMFFLIEKRLLLKKKKKKFYTTEALTHVFTINDTMQHSFTNYFTLELNDTTLQ